MIDRTWTRGAIDLRYGFLMKRRLRSVEDQEIAVRNAIRKEFGGSA